MNKKRLAINMFASLFAFAVQILINFLLTPYIVSKLGDEAYGFIGLVNGFVMYITILTTALNSMASRFITIEYHKNNLDKANKYYSSVFIANIFMSAVITILSITLIIYLEYIIKIPDYLISDVKLTFGLVILNFVISMITIVFTVSTFIKNRLDLYSISQIIGNFIKLIVLVILFVLFLPKIYYIIIATVISSIYILFYNYKITKKLTPELKISKSDFEIKSVKNLVKSGIWNSVNNLSRILLTGVDLLIANLFLGAGPMGILSIAKTVPNAVEGLLSTINSVFTPNLTKLYSEGNTIGVVNEVKLSMKILALIMTVPLTLFIVFGYNFYELWLPTKTSSQIMQIQILSVITIAPYILSSYIFTLFSIDTITNKLKRPVSITLIMGILNIIIVIILLNTTNLGIYAIAGVSSILWIIKIILFNPINAAINLKVKWNTFYPPFLRAIFTLIIIITIFLVINQYININNWLEFFVYMFIFIIFGYALNFYLLLSKTEKNIVIKYIKSRIKKNSRNM